MEPWLTIGRRRTGQAMVEYLVIATVIIAAILLVRPQIQTAVEALFTNAATQATNAAESLNNGR